MTMKNTSILIVEDEALVAEDLKAHIIDMGYQVSDIVNRGEDALTLLEGSRPDLVLMDIVLAGRIDGIDVAKVIKQHYHIPVIYLTAYTDKEKLERAQTTEPYGYLVKPFDERELRTTVSMALYKAEVDRDLRESQRWAQAVLSSIADAVITVDCDMRVEYLNAAAERLTGWASDTAGKRGLDEVMTLVDGQQAQLNNLASNLLANSELSKHKLFKHTFSTERETLQAELRAHNGTVIPIEITLAPIPHYNGGYGGLVIAFRDITHQLQVRERLDQSKAKLESHMLERVEAASEAKSRFLSIVSHELRGPLNPIIGYAELWKIDKDLSTEHRAQAETVYSSGQHLLSLINDILDVTHSDTGEGKLQSEPFELVDLVHQVEIAHQASAKKQGLQLNSTVTIPTSLGPSPLIVVGDLSQIREVLNRLLDNALRFTLYGKVELRLECTELDSGHLTVRFSVVDTGVGVTDKSTIFEPLTQLDDGHNRLRDGAGLGLTIAKRRVEHMGGCLQVADVAEGGSRFWFELDLALFNE